jgi:hypothetical protein
MNGFRSSVRWMCLGLALIGMGCGSRFSPTFTPAVGDMRTIQQTDFFTMHMDIMGQSVPMNISKNATWACEVLDVAEGDVTMRVTINEMRKDMGQDMLANIPGMGVNMAFLNDAQEALKGQAFTVTVSPGGEIRRLEGVEAIAQHVRSQVTLPPDLPEMARGGMLDDMFGESMVRKQIEQWMAPYQEINAKPGTTWVKHGADDFGMFETRFSQTYTLTSIEQGVATIVFERTFEPGAGGDVPMGAINARIEPQGSATGTVKMDANRGWIDTMVTQVNMTSTVTIEGMPPGMAMNMQITGNSTLETR